MAQAIHNYNRFHNLSHEQLADAIGSADAVLKGAEAECKALKEEFAFDSEPCCRTAMTAVATRQRARSTY